MRCGKANNPEGLFALLVLPEMTRPVFLMGETQVYFIMSTNSVQASLQKVAKCKEKREEITWISVFW